MELQLEDIGHQAHTLHPSCVILGQWFVVLSQSHTTVYTMLPQQRASFLPFGSVSSEKLDRSFVIPRHCVEVVSSVTRHGILEPVDDLLERIKETRIFLWSEGVDRVRAGCSLPTL